MQVNALYSSGLWNGYRARSIEEQIVELERAGLSASDASEADAAPVEPSMPKVITIPASSPSPQDCSPFASRARGIQAYKDSMPKPVQKPEQTDGD